MKLYVELKKRIAGVVNLFKEKESKIWSIIITAALIFMLMLVMNDKGTKGLKDENLLLKDQLIKTETKLQTTYFIIVVQNETIEKYKEALKRCNNEELKVWTPEKETK